MNLGAVIATMALCVSAVTAAPLDDAELSAQQLQPRANETRNDLVDGDPGSCPDVVLIFARGTNERGNIGSGVGLPLAGSLEDTYKGMWVQGVGGAYTASVGGNFEALGTTQEAIDQAKNLFTVAYDKCPSSAVVAGGYSQGSAVIAAALSQLKSESSIQDQVAGAVLFGYSMNKENDGKIPDFPEEKTRVYCNKTDLLCKGLLIILPSHYMYKGDATGDAPKFLEGRIEEADKGGWWD